MAVPYFPCVEPINWKILTANAFHNDVDGHVIYSLQLITRRRVDEFSYDDINNFLDDARILFRATGAVVLYAHGNEMGSDLKDALDESIRDNDPLLRDSYLENQLKETRVKTG